jgi:hypothetical protein
MKLGYEHEREKKLRAVKIMQLREKIEGVKR